MRQLDFQSWWVPEVDGSIDLIFGGLGSGKTYAATADMIRDLNDGRLVFSTWNVDWSGMDERKQIFKVLLGLLGLKRTFKVIPASNLHIESIGDPDLPLKFARSVNCVWYVDEAYAFLDSYKKTKMSMAERVAIYATRHFDRRLVLVAQRPNSIHVSARAMVNRFYECVRPFPFIQTLVNRMTFGLFRGLFIRVEYQDMIEETVDKENPASTKWYFAKQSIFKAYNSKYMRQGLTSQYVPEVFKYKYSYFELYSLFSARLRGGRAQPAPAPLPLSVGPVRGPLRRVSDDVRSTSFIKT